ncbi:MULTISPECIES: DUF1330 domain-containing protein [Rhizobium/Agrobacterium group]|uniref:DUF1330 domain-containing protein n=1 Tax=Rhizobium/Agrobacterium group TaxID=227290 RepID=UPI001ADCA1D0|nr:MULTISPECIES: DUF1330 domain-containing protein [Rhizobium/Agrobacterium group]MBO9112700.1 DUF1330 domain-containing protein [Agrobacterium sp. S2/73]QXZ76189.1 DUF1330 domain-containing protein [Agrobacterium sp. S7/73]QYA17262.1 DUF1330 domain-containing protein [Rhizobium sp. AB2/73]UEQ85621.1 DUF1330 domain-containing protein [Rhizobium sp. AB2/73]
MAKGYLIAQLTMTDPTKYSEYGTAATEVLERFRGRLLVRPASAVVVEGAPRPRTTIFEFDSFNRAKAFWESDEYAPAKKLRDDAADAAFILIEGVD